MGATTNSSLYSQEQVLTILNNSKQCFVDHMKDIRQCVQGGIRIDSLLTTRVINAMQYIHFLDVDTSCNDLSPDRIIEELKSFCHRCND